MNRTVFREERLQMIMNMIVENKKVYVNELAERFDRSTTSIRNDLTELEDRGLILRTHGGAILSEKSTDKEFVLQKNILKFREELFAQEKIRIGKAAIQLINDGDSVLIDGGSTTYYVAQQLKQKRGLTVFTSSYYIVPTLLQIPDASIYLTGGLLHREFEDMIGEISTDALDRFSPDHTIMGIDGISLKRGLTTTEPSVAENKRKMISISKELIIVADSTKFGKVCLVQITGFDKVDYVVTDNNVPNEFIDIFSTINSQLIVT